MAVKKSRNSSLPEKVRLRSAALAALPDPPIILETHAGEGAIFLQCYSHIRRGWAFEKEGDLVEHATRQREGWFCYKGEAEKILAEADDYFNANFIDIDPYGSPWPTFEALFLPGRLNHPTIMLCVHDGSRRFLSLGGSGANDQRWRKGILADLAKEFGDSAWRRYGDLAMVGLSRLIKPCGYTIDQWAYSNTGHDNHSTHYWATLKRSKR